MNAITTTDAAARTELAAALAANPATMYLGSLRGQLGTFAGSQRTMRHGLDRIARMLGGGEATATSTAWASISPAILAAVRARLIEGWRWDGEAGAVVHRGGTNVCMEGPAFYTRAESNLYRSWGGDIIGMTNLQEAKLAREAEICYCTLALVTDYDCWHDDHDHVTVEMIIGNLLQNATTAQQVIATAVGRLGEPERACACATALSTAIITRPSDVPAATRERLSVIMGKYLG
jgi:hypothetical protein